MAQWHKHHTIAELAEYQQNYGPTYIADLLPCHGCGTPTPVVLLDAKPPAGTPEEDRESADFTVLHCRGCYGPNWCPT